MARQRGTKWQADVVIDGKRKRVSFATQGEAEAYERNVANGLPASTSTTFRKFHEEHFKFLWGDNKAPQAVEWCLKALSDFIPDGLPIPAINSAYVVNLVSRMKATNVSNATINRRLSTLSKLLKHAEKLELTRRPTIEFLREAEGRERVLTRDEELRAQQFFLHCGMELACAVFDFLLYTGCRLGEVFSLTRDRVDNTHITFHYTVTKTSKTRRVPLTNASRAAWKFICSRSDLEAPFNAIPRDTFRDHWNRMRDHMGALDDEEFVPHMLRHTCASRLVSGGVPLPQVMLWMGHKSIQTTMRYSHLAPKDLDVAARVLEGA